MSHTVIRTIKKYLRYFWTMFKVSLNKDIQFRSNFIGYFFLTIIWFIQVYVLTFVVTKQFDNIAGWDPRQMYILASTWGFINGMTHCVFLGLFQLPYSITNGNLDSLLLKPVNSMVIASTNLFGLHNLLNAICYALVLIIILPPVSILTIVGFILLSLIGMLIQYFVWFIIVITTFHVGKLEGTFDLFSILKLVGKYPRKSYTHLNIIVQLLLIPFIIFASVPASLLVGKFKLTDGLIYLGTAATVGILAVAYWNFSIKRFTSASS